MKTQNRFFALLTVLCLMMLSVPAAASADSGTYRQFCMGSNRVTKRSTAVYDENFNPTGMTLPANTYLSCSWIGSDENAVIWHKAKYMLSDGTTGTGYVKDSDTGSTYINVKNSSGQIVTVNKFQYDNDWVYGDNVPAGQSYDLGGYYLDGQYYVDGEPVTDSTASIATGSSQIGDAVASPQDSGSGASTAVSSSSRTTTARKSMLSGASAVSQMITATISYNAPEGKEYAYIYAPNTGKATLRKTASSSGKTLKNMPAGRVVRVIEVNDGFTKVLYKDTVGYVLTNALHFYAADEMVAGTGALSYKGKTSGATTVNIRQKGSGDSRVIGEYKTGTAFTAITIGDAWTEIIIEDLSFSVRGFVKNEFLTMD